MDKNDELVLVVPTSDLFDKPFTGVITMAESHTKLTKALTHLDIKRRGDVEEDPSYKQLISYVVVKNNKGETLLYTRLSGGGESRLHGKSSVGVGGHMNPVDGLSGYQLLLENTKRELLEEIGVEPVEIGLYGLVNDDSNDVGQVHVGLIYIANIGDQEVTVTETDTLSVKWVPDTKFYELETWSQLLRDNHVI